MYKKLDLKVHQLDMNKLITLVKRYLQAWLLTTKLSVSLKKKYLLPIPYPCSLLEIIHIFAITCAYNFLFLYFFSFSPARFSFCLFFSYFK